MVSITCLPLTSYLTQTYDYHQQKYNDHSRNQNGSGYRYVPAFVFNSCIACQLKHHRLKLTILLLGAGPSGASITKALIAENHFTKVKVFEKRLATGGLWNYTAESDLSPVPSTDPNFTFKPILTKESKVIWSSPMYTELDTNVPISVMAYENFPFDPSLPLFAERTDVLSYMRSYAKDIESLVSFDTYVTGIRKTKDNLRWIISSKSASSLETSNPAINPNISENDKEPVDEEIFDAIAIAAGSYDVPFIPDKPGLKEWSSKSPGSIQHARSYRSPDKYDNKKVLVIGNSASGADLSFQIVQRPGTIVYKSIRSENLLPNPNDSKIIDMPDIKSFHYEYDNSSAEVNDEKKLKRVVRFVNDEIVSDIDIVLFATGYLKSLPFLSSLPYITDGRRVHNLYKQLISHQDPTIAILGLPRFVLPTRLSESQACYLARVWSHRISLPEQSEMIKWENDRVLKIGDGKEFHDLQYPEDCNYCDDLLKDIKNSKGDYGLWPVEWTPERRKLRSVCKLLKESFTNYRVKTGIKAHSIDELIKAGYFNWPGEEKGQSDN